MLQKLPQETPDPAELKRKYLEIALFDTFPPHLIVFPVTSPTN